MSKKLNWKPVRRGKIYCSSACGGNCRWTDYKEAKRKAENLVVRLGIGWKAVLNENLGWHWRVIRPEAKLTVYHDWDGKYSAWFEPENCAQFIEEAKTPEKAILRVIAKAKEFKEKLNKAFAAAGV